MHAGLLLQAGLVAALLVMLWVIPSWDTYRRRARRLAERVGLLSPAPPSPRGLPVERIAADARRIRTAIEHAPPGTPVARRRGWLAAYDEVLVDACRALGLEEHLAARRDGPLRDFERERVERMLVAAGLLADPGDRLS
ncbi:hypothetical protein [Nocardioides pacificus]